MILWLLGIPLWVQGHEVTDYPEKGVFVDGSTNRYVLQFDGPVDGRWKLALEAQGIRFYDYLPKYAFIIGATPEAIEKIRSFPHIQRIIPFDEKYKLPRDYRYKLNNCYEKEGDLYRVRILTFEKEDLDHIASLLKKEGYTVEGIARLYTNYVQALLPLDKIEELTSLDMVKFISFQYPIVNWNDENPVLHQAGIFDSLTGNGGANPTDTIVWMKGIRGQGEVLGHNDDELEASNCFFDGTVDNQNKIVDLCDYNNGGCGQNSLATASGHGTHTAGTAVGGVDEGTNGSAYKGMAYKARIVSQVPLGGGNSGFGTVLQDAYDRDARVHTNSWGYICNNCSPVGYNDVAQIIDEFVWSHPDMTVVFAAGNHGDDGRCSQGCDYMASDPATAKNDITVAAMERTTDAKASWSAYGSYPSGRFGNDVIAHGVTTWSACSAGASSTCANGCYIVGMSGTSMATPAVAGMAVLIRQYYRDGWFGDGTQGSATGINPSAALVRASLLASAIPITQDGDDLSDSPVPNGNEGAGRPALDNVMYFSPEDTWSTAADSADERKSKLWFVDIGNVTGLYTDETDEYKIYISNPNMVTRIVLSWIDTTASLDCAYSSGGCLVNDLDLVVVDSATGNVYYGNATTSGADNLTPANTFNDDDANTWEIVRLSGVSGTFYIRVHAENVATAARQRYALVVSGGLGEAPTPVNTPENVERFQLRHLWGKKLVLTTPYNRDLTIHIYSVSGRRVYSYSPTTINSGQVNLDLNHLPSGTYMMKVLHQGKEVFSRKIILN